MFFYKECNNILEEKLVKFWLDLLGSCLVIGDLFFVNNVICNSNYWLMS